MQTVGLLQLLTAEYAFDRGSGLRWSKANVTCLCTVSDVFLLQIHWPEIQS